MRSVLFWDFTWCRISKSADLNFPTPTLHSCVMADAVNWWPLSLEASVQSQVSSWEIFGGWSGLRQVFLQVLQFFPVVSFHHFSIPILHTLYSQQLTASLNNTVNPSFGHSEGWYFHNFTHVTSKPDVKQPWEESAATYHWNHWHKACSHFICYLLSF